MDLLLLCVIIFFSRILDVSLGTVRTILTVRGNRRVSALIGFGEVMIWFLVVREALNTDEKSIFIAVAFAGGYASGTFIGGLIAKKLFPSNHLVQVITSSRDGELLKAIGDAGFPMTVADVYGRDHLAEKYLLFIYIDGKYLDKLKGIIFEKDNNAFISVSEGKASYNGQIVPVEKRK
ncbi:MAG: DUF2179 domain-containing protein [Clostridiales bacterium]|nr:DUF2179 domain-containing protein [Clostridiales bacterium]